MRLSRRSLILGAGAAFAARPARAFVIPRNPLAYPGQLAPKFAPLGHVASYNCRYSAVASDNGEFYSLGPFHTAPVNGATVFTKSVDGIIGPALGGYTTAGYGTVDTGFYSTPDLRYTMAAIIRVTTVATADVGIFQLTVSGNAYQTLLGLNDANIQFTTIGITEVNSSLSLTAGPWFIAASTDNATVTNFIAVNLQTGHVLTSTSASHPGETGGATGTYSIGLIDTAFAGSVSAVMAAGQFLSLAQLKEWGQAPWDFWYPPSVEPQLFSSLAHSSAAAAAAPLRTLLGVGQ
jgi:hypothetical protein